MPTIPARLEAAPSLAVDQKAPRRVLWAGTIGNTLEFYDFIVYGAVAALAFGPLFFPAASPFAGTLLALSTFAVGFLARPVGALIFGALGDRVGRKRTLMITLLLMGISTVLIGCLPTFDQIGVFAPLLLVILRVIQGAAIGGEWGGAVIFLGEHAGSARRGRATSFAQLGSPAGTLLANAVVLILVSATTDEQFLAWGWRIPFLLSAILVGVGLYTRFKVEETPVFEAISQEARQRKIPVVELLRTSWRRLLMALGITVIIFASYYTFTTVALAHLKLAGMPSEVGLYGTVIGAAIGLPVILLVGPASDRFGRKPVFFVSLALIAMLAPFFFTMLDSKDFAVGVTAVALGLIAWCVGYGVYGAWLTELFPPLVRYTGVSLSYQIIGALAGMLPVIALSLSGEGANTTPIMLLLLGGVAISLVAALIAPETSGRKLLAKTAQDRHALETA